MLSRRTFLAALSLGPMCGYDLVAQPKTTRVKLGCQTNAWRIDPRDWSQVLTVLAKLKELGYDGFETGFRNIQPQFGNIAAARAQIEKTGLQFFGCHIFLDKYDEQTNIAPLDLVKTIADGAASFGAQRLILSGGGLIKDGKVDTEALKRKANGLNAAAQYCKTKGLQLAYHNHGPEFQNGGLEIEGLYKHTDPVLVDFLLDCGWAWRGGMDVPKFFAQHHQRIIGVHLRDFKGDFKSDVQIPLGQGDFPLSRLAAVIKQLKWQGWALNEEERLNGDKPGEAAVAPAKATLDKVFGR
ncbi:MAG TPA: sugar phosphate isomerase/epimerase family protein [Blastocatellia bacterium]|nr:sugar phosphate isomerase/epimerase family protein [Blastocatellia bacterium]